MISVVIPYYQREPGVLRRALASVAAQRDCPLPVHVIVVDDASPAPAGPEVDAVRGSGLSVEVVSQPNAGPGAARNTGLDHQPAGTRYIAFLDSDDEWSADHLARAVQALGAGFDFYFADLMQLGAQVSAFTRARRVEPRAHPQLPGLPAGLHAYHGSLLDQTIRANIIGTSTVVYDAERFRGQRFRVELRSAGEDYLFWMDIASSGSRNAFSSRCEATYGRGVNIYAGAGWGTPGHLRRIHDEMRYKKLVRSLYALNATQRRHIASNLASLRVAFARDLLHRLRHFGGLPLRLLAAHLALDPLSFALLVPNAVRVLLKKG